MDSFLMCSGMACVDKGSHNFTYHPHVYPQMERAMPVFTSTQFPFSWAEYTGG